jgi:hypothetical protein
MDDRTILAIKLSLEMDMPDIAEFILDQHAISLDEFRKKYNLKIVN